jgi:ABC-type branched-subunit amino acid transport system substrate-binding protein
MKIKANLITNGMPCLSLIFLLSFAAMADESHEREKYFIDSFLEAEHFFYSGEFEKAQLSYQNYLSGQPIKARSNRALYRLGEIHQKNKTFATALRYFEMVMQRSQVLMLLEDAKISKAQCLFELEQYDSAENIFKEVAFTHPDDKKKWQARIYLGRLDQKRLDYEKSIEKLKNIYFESEVKDVRDQAKNLIDLIIEKNLNKIALIRLSEKYSSGFPLDHILLRLISIYREERDLEQLQNLVLKYLQLFPNHPQSLTISSSLKKIEENKENKIRLGVVVPLTGETASSGQQILQGIQLAVNETILAQDGTSFEIITKDSESAPIEEIIEELAIDPNIIGIVGPVRSKFVKKVVPLADKYRLPIFTPSASSVGLAELSPYVFRNVVTRDLQGKYIAKYAVNTLGLYRFVVFYPLEAYGLELKDSFIEEIEALGGEVVSVISYERSQSDFKKQIVEMGGIDDDKLKSLVIDQVKNNLEPEVLGHNGLMSRPLIEMGLLSQDEIQNLKVSLMLSYDAIFLPGFFDKVGLIVPQLVFYNINAPTLLGTSGWNSPELTKMTGKYMQEGYFVDGFYSQSKRSDVVKFIKEYKNTFSEDPTTLSAQSYDVAKMYIQSIRSGAKNRIQVKEALLKIRNFMGASGETEILPTGEADKKLFTMKIIKNKIVEAN